MSDCSIMIHLLILTSSFYSPVQVTVTLIGRSHACKDCGSARIENVTNQVITRSTTTTSVASLRHFRNRSQVACGNLAFDSSLRNTKAGADQRLVAFPFVAG